MCNVFMHLLGGCAYVMVGYVPELDLDGSRWRGVSNALPGMGRETR